MANDSPAKSLGDIDLSSLRVSLTGGGGGMRAACRPALLSLPLSTQSGRRLLWRGFCCSELGWGGGERRGCYVCVWGVCVGRVFVIRHTRGACY